MTFAGTSVTIGCALTADATPPASYPCCERAQCPVDRMNDDMTGRYGRIRQEPLMSWMLIVTPSLRSMEMQGKVMDATADLNYLE